MRLYLNSLFSRLWAHSDPFVAVEALPGQVVRALEGRCTFRTVIEGSGYFVKIHRGIGWREILKNGLSLRAPVLGARNEWQALVRLKDAGVPSMTPVAFGERGWNPARQHSFLITEELAPTLSLEDFCMHWAKQPPNFSLKRALIAEVARMTARMHRAGVNHRDYYICHFLLHTNPEPTPTQLRLSLIDLHRAQTRVKTPTRWRNKDLAALYFSVLEIGLTQRDYLRFLQGYFQQPLRQILTEQRGLLAWLTQEAQRLYARKQRYGEAL